MAKKFAFNIMSTRRCAHPMCIKLIKQRLVDKDPAGTKFTLCYKHWHQQEYNRRGNHV